MTIQLSPEQEQWLKAQVAAGHFASLEQAVAVAVADLMATVDDDLDWAKPQVDAAAEELARGEGIPAEEAVRRMRSVLKRQP
jgi:Arc/MetJ-type ribon-helix-helix transcriptional regulator